MCQLSALVLRADHAPTPIGQHLHVDHRRALVVVAVTRVADARELRRRLAEYLPRVSLFTACRTPARAARVSVATYAYLGVGALRTAEPIVLVATDPAEVFYTQFDRALTGVVQAHRMGRFLRARPRERFGGRTGFTYPRRRARVPGDRLPGRSCAALGREPAAGRTRSPGSAWATGQSDRGQSRGTSRPWRGRANWGRPTRGRRLCGTPTPDVRVGK